MALVKESGQWLENVDRTHLVLASVNPVLQKSMSHYKRSYLLSSSRPCGKL